MQIYSIYKTKYFKLMNLQRFTIQKEKTRT